MGMFISCWAMLAQHQALFCFRLCPNSEEADGEQENGRGQSQDSWPQQTKGTFQTTWHHTQDFILREEEGNRGLSEWWLFFFQVSVTCDRALLSWGWRTTAMAQGKCEWIGKWQMSSLVCLCAQLLLSLLNCLYPNPRVLSLLPFPLSSPVWLGIVSKWLCGSWLPAGLKSQLLHTREQITSRLLFTPGALEKRSHYIPL